MKFYAAYGSNLNLGQMARRCPDAKAVGTCVLDGYQLIFRRGYLTIEKKEGTKVPLGIWMISDNDEKRLDRYEGYPTFYRKQNLQVGGSDCLVYIMNDGYSYELPTEQYLRTVIEGYRDFLIDMEPLMQAIVATHDSMKEEGK